MTHWETMWCFHTRNFSISWQIAPEEFYQYDGDDENGEIQRKINNGEYYAFMSRVVVLLNGTEVGADYLGGSVYATPSEFRDHIGSQGKYGSYFTDMVRQAISEARKTLGNVPKLRHA